MEINNLVPIDLFCKHHHVDFSFIDSLYEFGLIEVVVVENYKYLPHENLKEIEKLTRLHNDLGINIEGIDAISNLLRQINDLQQELAIAKNKLQLFDNH
jgi:MerR HTH family regulatory protein